jgi:hypothetical protein
MPTKSVLAVLALAATLPACNICRDGDIGSKNCLAERGGLGSGLKGPIGIVENVLWLPYKAVATPLTGIVQGGVGWYEECGEPVSATLTLPVGMAFGLIIGTGNSIGQEPFFVERDDNFFDCLVNPYITDQEIYKYTTPPHARPRYAPPGPIGGLPAAYDSEGYSETGSAPPALSFNLRVRH